MSSIAALKAQFDLHTRLFNNVLNGITDADANDRKSDDINHIKWVAGHLLHTRLTSINKLAGGQPDSLYAAHFSRGMALDAAAVYPSINEITAKWNEVSGAISEGLTQISEDVLNAPSPAKAPIADESVRGLLSFLVSHEAYHIGQLSLLRKLVGKNAMSYA